MIIAYSYVALVVAAPNAVGWIYQAMPGERSQSDRLEPEYDIERAAARALENAPAITEDDIEFMTNLFASKH